MKGDAAVAGAAADDVAAAEVNRWGSMISVNDGRMVEFSQTLPELCTASSSRQSLDSMVAFLEMSAQDLRCGMRQCSILRTEKSFTDKQREESRT